MTTKPLSPYDQFWAAVEQHPDARVRRITRQKGKRWGDLTPAEKHEHQTAIAILNGDEATR